MRLNAIRFKRSESDTVQSKNAGGLDDLRRSSILEIGIVMLVLGWLVMLSSISFQGNPRGLLVALSLVSGAVGIFGLRQTHLNLALAVLVISAIAATAAQKWLFPEGVAQFYYPVVIVACSALLSGWKVFGVATLASAAVLVIARAEGASWLDAEQITTPIALNYLTAFAAWLGSRQMHIALAWLESSYSRANELLEQLRDERRHLALTIKMLEDAHYRITRLNYSLIEARSAAEEARRLKAEFAANISHELRTPLNMIIGFSETMANAPETYRDVVWSPILRGDIEQIYRSSRHLSGLIDDILDLSALEAQELGLTVEETRIEDVIGESVGVVQDLYRAKQLYLKTEIAPDLPPVRLDSVRIRQVLLNLLTNAIRYTRTGGVTITARQVANKIEVSVQDTGIGIAARDIARVFEEFGQVDGTTSRKHEGTGLGIPLSKRLVELHGGELWLESEVGVGTTFFFTLPVGMVRRAASSAAPAARHATDSAASTGTRHPENPFQRAQPRGAPREVLLAVEPDPLLLKIIRRHIGAYDVIEVAQVDDLPAMIERHQPVALLIDTPYEDRAQPLPEWALPVVDDPLTGSNARVPGDLPLISVSLPGSVKRAQSLGIENYLVKPVLREQLLRAIAEVEKQVETILIVDDDPQLVELLSRMLESSGKRYRLRTAYQGLEALELLEQERVDLVLLDLVMPELGGMDVLYAMKQDPVLSRIPVIVISAQPTAEMTPEIGLFLQVYRPKETSLAEVLGCIKALLPGLPRRDPVLHESLPASSRVPAAQPAF